VAIEDLAARHPEVKFSQCKIVWLKGHDQRAARESSHAPELIDGRVEQERPVVADENQMACSVPRRGVVPSDVPYTVRGEIGQSCSK
jgi:hypothetical protein